MTKFKLFCRDTIEEVKDMKPKFWILLLFVAILLGGLALGFYRLSEPRGDFYSEMNKMRESVESFRDSTVGAMKRAIEKP